MKITVVGAGYVGLVVAVSFACGGHQVICLETNKERCNLLNTGHCPILENQLPEMLNKAVATNGVRFTTNAREALPSAEVIFITVGTPSGENGKADLSDIYGVISDIIKNAELCKFIVIKSSVPPGTTDKIQLELREERNPAHIRGINVICNPEFLREGTAVNDFLAPDRIVIGSHNHNDSQQLLLLYRSLLKNTPAEVLTTPINAELIKYASNSYLAVRLSYINEWACLCEAIGGNINDVTLGMGLDHRIGQEYLNAGLGYGGACLPKDTKALIYSAKQSSVSLSVLESAIQANDALVPRIAHKISNYLSVGSVVSVLGVSFKAGTDDIRNSPILSLVEQISDLIDCNIQIYDPSYVKSKDKYPSKLLVHMVNSLEEAIYNADVLIVGTAWEQFGSINTDELAMNIKGKIIFDFAKVFNKEHLNEIGFKYITCGECD